jgi:hypothetical protein
LKFEIGVEGFLLYLLHKAQAFYTLVAVAVLTSSYGSGIPQYFQLRKWCARIPAQAASGNCCL